MSQPSWKIAAIKAARKAHPAADICLLPVSRWLTRPQAESAECLLTRVTTLAYGVCGGGHGVAIHGVADAVVNSPPPSTQDIEKLTLARNQVVLQARDMLADSSQERLHSDAQAVIDAVHADDAGKFQAAALAFGIAALAVGAAPTLRNTAVVSAATNWQKLEARHMLIAYKHRTAPEIAERHIAYLREAATLRHSAVG